MNKVTTYPAGSPTTDIGTGGLRLARYGYYLRAAASAVKILSAAIRHGEPRMIIPPNRDFGNVVDRGDQQQRKAAGAGEISNALQQARRERRPVVTAAAAHSCAGQTLSRGGGTRLFLQPAVNAEAVWLDDERLEVPATWRWQLVEDEANSKGRTFPVLTDNLDTRVGGTLSVSGIGTRSVSFGRQVDWVDSLRLILPDGRIEQCSTDTHPELFASALAGLGQIGVIDTVVLKTLPLRQWTASLVYQVASLSDAARVISSELDWGGHFPTHLEVVGPQIGSRYIHLRLGWEADSKAAAATLLQAVRRQPLPIAAELLRSKVMSSHGFGQVNIRHVQSYIASLKSAAHLWNDWFFPDPAGYRHFVDWCEQTLLPTLGTRDLVAGFMLRLATHPERPHLPLSYARNQAGHVDQIGLYYSVSLREAGRVDAVKQGLTRAQAMARECGGRLYLYGWQQWSKADWQAEFGQDYEAVLALKRRLDPDFLLNPDTLQGSP